MKHIFSSILVLTLSFAGLSQSSVSYRDKGGTSYYDSCEPGIINDYQRGSETCFEYRCSSKVTCIPTKDSNYMKNEITINDNKKTSNNTTNHNTTNNIHGSAEAVLTPSLNACRDTCFKKGRYKGGKNCSECLNTYSITDNVVTEHDFYVDIELSCSRCAEDPKSSPNCNVCSKIDSEVASVCEHSDTKCTEREKNRVKGKYALGVDCVDCEMARINAERDVAIAKENRKAAKHKYKERNGAFWQAMGTLGTAAAGVLAPLLVEKERTKQITSCHNSFANAGADVVMQNRLAFETEVNLQSANSLPLTTWEQMGASQNLSHLCNGGGAGGFAGFPGQGFNQFGMGGFNPYGQQNGFGQQFNGFGGNSIGGGLQNGFGNVFNNLQGIMPNIQFGANVSGGVGSTAWSQPNQGYFGTNTGSQYPYGGGVGVNGQYPYGGGGAAFNQPYGNFGGGTNFGGGANFGGGFGGGQPAGAGFAF